MRMMTHKLLRKQHQWYSNSLSPNQAIVLSPTRKKHAGKHVIYYSPILNQRNNSCFLFESDGDTITVYIIICERRGITIKVRVVISSIIIILLFWPVEGCDHEKWEGAAQKQGVADRTCIDGYRYYLAFTYRPSWLLARYVCLHRLPRWLSLGKVHPHRLPRDDCL